MSSLSRSCGLGGVGVTLFEVFGEPSVLLISLVELCGCLTLIDLDLALDLLEG